jgi:hypothetical protein
VAPFTKGLSVVGTGGVNAALADHAARLSTEGTTGAWGLTGPAR